MKQIFKLFDIQKLYTSCASMAERLTSHRCSFFIIFVNLYFYTMLLLDFLIYKVQRMYATITTFDGVSRSQNRG